MDMYHITQLRDGGVATHQNANLLNDVGGMGPVGVTAEDETWGLMGRGVRGER